jgi:hypothetical protein
LQCDQTRLDALRQRLPNADSARPKHSPTRPAEQLGRAADPHGAAGGHRVAGLEVAPAPPVTSGAPVVGTIASS